MDDEENGYIDWEKFLEGMKIVFSKSDGDRVDLFLRMVDEDGGGTYGFDEIKEICLMSLGEKSAEPKYDKFGNLEIDIIEETAEFQSKDIFRLLKYDIDDEIPIEVFKHHTFHGSKETQAALRQFCCLDWIKTNIIFISINNLNRFIIFI